MASRWQVRLLGTGGAANERRHQACLLVEGNNRAAGPILLDAGNGLDVVRQLVAIGRDPCEVRDIFISHQHLDHLGGLDPLLLWSVVRTMRVRGGPPEQETRVYAEPRILAAIHLFHAATAATPIIDLYAGKLTWVPIEDGVTADLPGGIGLTPFLVDHLPTDGGALGCVLDLGEARIAYSGDTRPCERLVEMVGGADVLFHEAGGLDEHAAAVHRSGHSTAGDAGRAARAAGVGRLVLTHLPDDALAERMRQEARAAFGEPVDLARDLEIVTL